jgi:hypothetical protein
MVKTMRSRSIREPRDHLSRPAHRGGASRFAELVAAGIVRLPVEPGDPLADWPSIELRAGTVAKLIEADRGEE